MARCELSGKSTVSKNLVSHSNIKTKSRAQANVHSKKFFSYQLKNSFRLRVASSTLKNIDKYGGFDNFIMKQKKANLSGKAQKIQKQIFKKTQQQAKTKT